MISALATFLSPLALVERWRLDSNSGFDRRKVLVEGSFDKSLDV